MWYDANTVQGLFVLGEEDLYDLSKKKKMKLNLITLSFVLFLMSVGYAQQQSLTVVVKNVKETKGKIAVALFNSEKDFTKNRLQGKTTVAESGEVHVVFENLAPGEYAVSVMHDANQNDDLDSNAFGIPKEGFGFSNDAMGMFGPPSFEKAKFKIEAVEKKIVISLRYM